jgi:hypothetical protein
MPALALVSRQADALRALLALVTALPDLPAADFTITTHQAVTDLRVNIHDSPAGFEEWREALDLDPQHADGRRNTTFHSVEIPGRFHGVRILLVGYLPLPIDHTDHTDRAAA